MKKDTIALLTSAIIPNQSIGNYTMIHKKYASKERVNQTKWDMPHIEFCTREVDITEHFVSLAVDYATLS